ncbi:MAG: TRAP transporter substrate-binding protein [Deltaproteobacteria bacterium]|nr:TRAP transporter substrate-binding protein [Deltaproteobacteria bacterium]MBW2120226.1 TRAP transporter substrate-binding protein [Deltaproteobacteria bacterium]
MIRKALVVSLCVFLIVAFGPVTSVAAKTVVLKMAMYQPAKHAFVKFYQSMLPKVKKITGGRVKVKLFHSSTLLKSTNMDEGINKGVADMGLSYPPMVSASIPFMGLTDLPGIWRDTKGFNDAFDNGVTDLYEQAYHEGGMKNIKIVGLANIGFWYIATTKKLVKVPSDLAGLKIAGCGRMHVKYIDACGGKGVYIPIVERYEAMERGIVDGGTGFTSNFVSWRFMEPCKYFLDFGHGLGPMMLIINSDSLKKIPEDLRASVLGILKLIVLSHRGVMAAETSFNHDVIMPQHMEYYRPTPEEVKLWRDAGKPLVEEWLSKTGPLGRKAMDIVEKYNQR